MKTTTTALACDPDEPKAQIDHANMARLWPYSLVGRTARIQTGAQFAVAGRIVAVQPVDDGSPEVKSYLIFVETMDNATVVIPERAIVNVWFDPPSAYRFQSYGY